MLFHLDEVTRAGKFIEIDSRMVLAGLGEERLVNYYVIT